MRAYEGKRALRWLWASGCLVTYIEENKLIDEALWAEWLAALDSPKTKTAIVSGWGPIQASTAQWRQFTNLAKDSELLIAVLTDARHNAALAKKAAWVGAKIKSFKWDKSLYEPFAYLGFDLDTRKALKPKVFELRDYHGGVGDVPGPSPATAPVRPSSSPRAPLRESTKPKREMPAWMRDEPVASKRPGALLSSIEQRGAGVRGSSPSRAPSKAAKPAAATPAPIKPAPAKPAGLAADIRRSRDTVFRSSSDIQAKLAEVQARLRARNLEMQRRREG